MVAPDNNIAAAPGAPAAGEVRVEIEGAGSVNCTSGTAVGEILPAEVPGEGLPVIGARVNNDIVSLSYPLEVSSSVVALSIQDSYGWRIYRDSMCFLLAKCVQQLFPEAQFSVEHSLGSGLYCSFSRDGRSAMMESDLRDLEQRMQFETEKNLAIVRRKITFNQALQYFAERRQQDKFDLLRHRNPPKIPVYQCADFLDLAHHPLAPNTGVLKVFKLIRHNSGFVLQLPAQDDPRSAAPFKPQPELFDIFRAHKEWGRTVHVRTAGDLNRIIAAQRFSEFVRVMEAFQEKRIARLADEIAAHRGEIRWIVVAGPTSSGKTTFAKRIADQLSVVGVRTRMISLDHYFVDRDRTPRTIGGDYDYEHIEALDLPLFNEHLAAMDRGGEVFLPHFDFRLGKRIGEGQNMRLAEGEMVLMEGIHGLNPRLTEAVPDSHKHLIYISALTQLNLDDNNRVSTTDNRLIRRLVRDHAYRGHGALKTLQMWPNVRRGERQWIFPYQRRADSAFNSALDYELAILKPFAEALLAEVKPDHPQYAEARRLQAFLSGFLVAPASPVPPTSILREFIGRSSFQY